MFKARVLVKSVAEKPKKPAYVKPKKPFRHRKSVQASKLTSKLVDRALRRKGFAQSEIIKRWPLIVGKELAENSVPLRLKFPYGENMDATLFVRVESAYAPVLLHGSEFIKQHVNAYFGYRAVAKISLKQGPLKHQRRGVPLPVEPLLPAEEKRLNQLLTKPSKTSMHDESDLTVSLRRLGEAVIIGTRSPENDKAE